MTGPVYSPGKHHQVWCGVDPWITWHRAAVKTGETKTGRSGTVKMDNVDRLGRSGA